MSISAQDPILPSYTIALVALVLYAIATTNPEFIILASLILSLFIPYAYHANDDPATRRKLWRTLENGDRPKEWKAINGKYNLKEKYWVNSRFVYI